MERLRIESDRSQRMVEFSAALNRPFPLPWEPRKNNLSTFPLVGQPPSAVMTLDSRGRLSHIQSHAPPDLLKLFFRGSLVIAAPQRG